MRVQLKGINKVTKRLANGALKSYYYAWKGGPRLEGKPGTPEFVASYNAAVSKRVKQRDDLFRSLIDRYMESAAYRDLAECTRRDYGRQIRFIDARFGDLPLSALSDGRVRGDFLAWRDEQGKTSPRQADMGFSVLARIVSWGYDKGIAPANPCLNPKRLYKGSRRENVWTEADEAAFYGKAPKHLHLALTLALWTGQRRSDLLLLTWSAYDGKFIRLTQQKTGSRVVIPVAETLRLALDSAKAKLTREEMIDPARTILVTVRGSRAWTGEGFSASWRTACAAAGLIGLTFHDLRGTAITRLALAGCTVPEISTITGHSLQDVHAILHKHYLNPDLALAESAIRKLENQFKRPTGRPTDASKSDESSEISE